MAAEQTEGGRRILWWLILEVVLLLAALLTLATWTHDDYHYSVYAVFAVGVVVAALALPATAVYWLSTESEEAEH